MKLAMSRQLFPAAVLACSLGFSFASSTAAQQPAASQPSSAPPTAASPASSPAGQAGQGQAPASQTGNPDDSAFKIVPNPTAAMHLGEIAEIQQHPDDQPPHEPG